MANIHCYLGPERVGADMPCHYKRPFSPGRVLHGSHIGGEYTIYIVDFSFTEIVNILRDVISSFIIIIVLLLYFINNHYLNFIEQLKS